VRGRALRPDLSAGRRLQLHLLGRLLPPELRPRLGLPRNLQRRRMHHGRAA